MNGGYSCWSVKSGDLNDGVCGFDNVIEVKSAGPPRVIVFAEIGATPGEAGAWYDMQGTTVDGITGATYTGDGTVIVVPLIPTLPSTAPAGSAAASRKILAMANAIKSFTLINNTLLD